MWMWESRKAFHGTLQLSMGICLDAFAHNGQKTIF